MEGNPEVQEIVPTPGEIYQAAGIGCWIGIDLYEKYVAPELPRLSNFDTEANDTVFERIIGKLRGILRGSGEIYSALEIDAVKLTITYILENHQYPDPLEILFPLSRNVGVPIKPAVLARSMLKLGPKSS